jgi:hypothetical protein
MPFDVPGGVAALGRLAILRDIAAKRLKLSSLPLCLLE